MSKKSLPKKEDYVTVLLTEYQSLQDSNARAHRDIELLHKKIKTHEEKEAEMRNAINELQETVKILTPFDSAANISKEQAMNQLKDAYKAFEYEVTTTQGVYIKMLVNPIAKEVMIIELRS